MRPMVDRDRTKTISVVIPTHDRAQLLVEAVESVLAQSAPPGEIIVVDDCSQDETPHVLRAFGQSLKVVRLDEPHERGAARNIGARAASGQLLAFLDSDDVWEPEKLECQLSATRPGVPSVTGLRLIDADGRLIGRDYIPNPPSERELFVNNYCIGGPSSLVTPKAVFAEVGGFPEDLVFQGSEDWMFLVKLLWAGWPLQLVREPLVRYRVHSGGSTQRAMNLERSMWAACKWFEHEGLGPPRLVARRRSFVAAAIARGYIAEGNLVRARHWASVAVRHGGPWTRVRNTWRILRTIGRRGLDRLAGQHRASDSS